MNIDFTLLNEVSSFSDDYEAVYLKIIQQTCTQLHIKEDIEVSCILVDDERIHQINKEYRQMDRATDVISFAMEDSKPLHVEGLPRCLGDIFISVEKAELQAKDYGHSMEREMCFLFTHGLLHLLGYDHMEEDEEKEMIAMQKKILDALQIERG
ncbi:MAG: rRNA maturation RNase YbeY [Coprobacillaceae bacterium]